MHKPILLSLLFAPPYVFAQNNYAVLSGSVVDQQHSSIVGASVELTSLGTHAVRRVTSNEQGILLVVDLLPDDYQLVVQAPGFEPLTETLQLEVGQKLAVEAALGIRAVKQGVPVNASADVLRTTDSHTVTLV